MPERRRRRHVACPLSGPLILLLPPLALPLADTGTLLAGKPAFRKLEFTGDMLSHPADLEALRARHPGVTFKAVE